MPVYRVINYTDGFDVDEDVVSISKCDGKWDNGEWGGVTFRDLYDSSTTSGDYVASSDIRN